MKKRFDWDRFLDTSNKIAVRCKTEEEATAFCNLMHEHGLKWRDGASYTKKTGWSHYKNRTCYESDGGFSDKEYFEENGYRVVDFSDYDFRDGSEKVLLNAEFYKEKIDALQGLFMITRSTNKIELCNGGCRDCMFDNLGESCRISNVKWLLSPYEPPKKKLVITDTVKTFLKMCNAECYIARNKNGKLFIFEQLPTKIGESWSYQGSCATIKETITKDLYEGFNFIKWEDDEPWKVAELLQIAAEQ